MPVSIKNFQKSWNTFSILLKLEFVELPMISKNVYTPSPNYSNPQRSRCKE